MFMASARPNPLDSTRPRPAPESRAQNWDTPNQRLFFVVLLKALLGIALAHPTLTREARDYLTGVIRGLIERLEQRQAPAPSTNPAHTNKHRGTAAILARPSRNRAPIAARRRRPRAEPAPRPPAQAPHCASANQVRGPPHHHPPVRDRSIQPPTPAPRCPPHRRLAAQRVAPA